MTDAEPSPADALAQLSFLVLARIEARAAAEGLSVVQARMLGILRDRTPLISDLGAQLGLNKSSISGLVDRAAKRGLVERLPSTEDRRAVHIGLTPRGHALIAGTQEGFEADIAALLIPLTDPQRNTLVRLAERIFAENASSIGDEMRRG